MYITIHSPNSVHTVGVLAVILGLADSFRASRALFCHQLLCAGAVLGACCLAPVQARRSPTPLSPEKHSGFSTLFLSGQKVVLLAPGRPLVAPGSSLVAPEGPWMSLQGSLEVPLEPLLGSFIQGSSTRIPPLRILLQEYFLRISLAGFLSRDSTSRIPP